VWLGDTRILSDYVLSLDGQQMQKRDLEVHPGWAAFEGTAGSLSIRQERYVEEGLHDRITLTNEGSAPVDVQLQLDFGADFAAMLAVRGIVNLPPPKPSTLTATDPGATIGKTNLVVTPAGREQRIRIDPGERKSIVVDVMPNPGVAAGDFEQGLNRVRKDYENWSSECAAFETDNPTLNELIQQSRDDMRMLLDHYPTGMYPTGGLPWFAVPFGRDALITSSCVLPVNPDVARGALRFLAAHQGRRVDPSTEEEPGKILHEVRSGEVVEKGLWPHILYGTVDATPLFLAVLAETVEWTGDLGLLDELWQNAEAALAWCDTYGDKDGDGYIEYSIGVEARNEGWKDSNDSLTNVDGTDAGRPAALCEVQGYLYRALMGMARRRPELKARAAALKRRFDRDFWIPRERFVAQALDSRKQCVEAITSNPGHCLWTGIVPSAHARAVAQRMVSPELFCGWGIRTLSTRAINYDPCSYHNGSVWPHDSAIAAAGLRAAGFPAEAELVARATLEAGMSYPDRRLPELFCGTDRGRAQKPDDYDASCSPQNWGAASAFRMISTILGLGADASRGRLRIAPVETALWKRLEVTGLHFAGQRIDFSVEGTRVKVGSVPRGVKVETI
jgi:glycogen debranching enzyme